MRIDRIKPFYKSKITHYLGWQKSFQGFGLMFSIDNPLIMNTKYLLVEFKFMYLTFWLTYEIK